MELEITSEFRELCQQIVAQDKSPEDWAASESDDMFQVGDLTGGYDASEEAFCFETYVDGAEYWFQFTLAEAQAVADGHNVSVELRPAE